MLPRSEASPCLQACLISFSEDAAVMAPPFAASELTSSDSSSLPARGDTTLLMEGGGRRAGRERRWPWRFQGQGETAFAPHAAKHDIAPRKRCIFKCTH